MHTYEANGLGKKMTKEEREGEREISMHHNSVMPHAPNASQLCVCVFDGVCCMLNWKLALILTRIMIWSTAGKGYMFAFHGADCCCYSCCIRGIWTSVHCFFLPLSVFIYHFAIVRHFLCVELFANYVIIFLSSSAFVTHRRNCSSFRLWRFDHGHCNTIHFITSSLCYNAQRLPFHFISF